MDPKTLAPTDAQTPAARPSAYDPNSISAQCERIEKRIVYLNRLEEMSRRKFARLRQKWVDAYGTPTAEKEAELLEFARNETRDRVRGTGPHGRGIAYRAKKVGLEAKVRRNRGDLPAQYRCQFFEKDGTLLTTIIGVWQADEFIAVAGERAQIRSAAEQPHAAAPIPPRRRASL